MHGSLWKRFSMCACTHEHMLVGSRGLHGYCLHPSLSWKSPMRLRGWPMSPRDLPVSSTGVENVCHHNQHVYMGSRTMTLVLTLGRQTLYLPNGLSPQPSFLLIPHYTLKLPMETSWRDMDFHLAHFPAATMSHEK